MASASGVRAGRAFIEVFLKKNGIERGFNAIDRRMKKFAAGARQLGAKLFGAGAVISAPFGLSLGILSQFDDRMSAVKAKTGATADEFKRLREEAKRLGSSTSFSASQVADAENFLAQAGFSPDQIIDALPDVLNVAKAGQLDLGLATDITTDVASAFGMPEDIKRVGDVLANTAASSNTSIEQLGEGFKFVAPIANAAGQEIEGVAIAAGLLGNNGIKGSKAGTDLKNILTVVAKNADIAGVSTRDAANNIRPLGDIMRDVGEATKSMTDGDRVAFFMDTFGKISGTSAVVLANSGEAFDTLGEKINNSAGAAKKMADIMDDNIGGSFRSALSAIEGVAISLGEAVAPAIRSITDGFTKAAQATIAWIKENKQAVVVAATLGAGLLTVGTALVTTGVAVSVLSFGMGGLVKTFKLLLSPLGLVFKLFGGVKVLAGATLAAFGLIPGLIAAVLSPLGLVTAAIVGVGAALFATSDIPGQLGDEFGSMARSTADGFRTLTQNVVAGWGEIKTIGRSAIGAIVERIGRGDIKGAFNVAILGIKAIWATFVASVIETWAPIKVAIIRTWKEATDFLKANWNGFVDFFKGAMDALGVDWRGWVKIVTGNDGARAVGISWNDMIFGLKATFVNFGAWLESFWLNLVNVAKESAKAIADAFVATDAFVLGSNTTEGIATGLRLDAKPAPGVEIPKTQLELDLQAVEDQRVARINELDNIREANNEGDAASVAGEIDAARKSKSEAVAAFDDGPPELDASVKESREDPMDAEVNPNELNVDLGTLRTLDQQNEDIDTDAGDWRKQWERQQGLSPDIEAEMTANLEAIGNTDFIAEQQLEALAGNLSPDLGSLEDSITSTTFDASTVALGVGTNSADNKDDKKIEALGKIAESTEQTADKIDELALKVQ